MLLHECTTAACHQRQMGWTPVSGCRCLTAMIDTSFFPDYPMFGVCAWCWSSGGFCRGASGQSAWAGRLLLGHPLFDKSWLFPPVLQLCTRQAPVYGDRWGIFSSRLEFPLTVVWGKSCLNQIFFINLEIFFRFYTNLRCKLEPWCGAQQNPFLEVVFPCVLLHNDICARQALSVLSLLFIIIFMYFPSKAITALGFFFQQLQSTET